MYILEEINNQNPVLNQVIIKNEKLNFYGSIFPNLGASLQKLSINNIDIIDGIPANEEGLNIYKSKYNSSFLFPFPNRIPNGQYTFNNVDYELTCNESIRNNALHGHIHDKSFLVEDLKASNENAIISFTYLHAENTPGYPFPYKLRITYTFSQNKLSIDFSALNNGTGPLPFGIGWHPYFKTSKLENCVLDFESESQIYFNENELPQQELPIKYRLPINIDKNEFDDGFILKNSKTTFKTTEYSVLINSSTKPPNSIVQVYTPPDRKSIAIEPQTCGPDCLNDEVRLLVLSPRKSYSYNIELVISI